MGKLRHGEAVTCLGSHCRYVAELGFRCWEPSSRVTLPCLKHSSCFSFIMQNRSPVQGHREGARALHELAAPFPPKPVPTLGPHSPCRPHTALSGSACSINTLEPLGLSSPALDSRGIGINNRGSCPQEAHVEFLSTYCVLEPKEGTGDTERK